VSTSIYLRPDDRKTLLHHYRSSPIPAVRLRCHLLLLLDAGHPWALILTMIWLDERRFFRVHRHIYNPR
jgi:hypothetical protein